ncbi:MAG: FAD-binding oxidoreductase, partial [Pseudaminobacter sp.]|nr:FAD-binding oxidoreductase [Pseudaminobacter sp.]
SVVLLEQESRPGYHTTGRSAAIFIQNYGNETIRALSRASAPLFTDAARDLFPTPLLSPRGMLNIADADGISHHANLLAESEGLHEISVAEALALVPALRADRIAAASYEEDARDIDIAALHQGWLKSAKLAGGQTLTDAGVTAVEYADGLWSLETPKARVIAKTVVNAAGAWADQVAALCGLAPIGLTPMRRSMAVLPAPEGFDTRHWPLVGDGAETWYMKPDGGRLLVSPADEDPVEPHDAFVDDMVLAEGLHRFEQAMVFPVTHVERSWAGLRTFAPDRTPVAGFDSAAGGFFWLAGQGGYGIQTAPALSRLAGQMIRRASLPTDMEALVAALTPNRFR